MCISWSLAIYLNEYTTLSPQSSLPWSSLSPSIRTSAFKLNESESFDFNPLRSFQCPFLPYQTDLDYLRSSQYCVLFRPASIGCVFLEKPPTLAQAQLPSLISRSTCWKWRIQWTNRKPLHPLANWDTALLHKLKAEDTMNQQEVPPPFGQLRHSGRREGHPERTCWKGRLPLSRLLAPAGLAPAERGPTAAERRAPTAVRQRGLFPHPLPLPPGGLGRPQRALVSDSSLACFPSSSLITDITCALWSEAFPPHSWTLSPWPPKVSLYPSKFLKTSICISASASELSHVLLYYFYYYQLEKLTLLL